MELREDVPDRGDAAPQQDHAGTLQSTQHAITLSLILTCIETQLFCVYNVQGLQAPTHLLKQGSTPLHMVDILREMQLMKLEVAASMTSFSGKILGCVTSLVEQLAQPHAAAPPTAAALGAIRAKAKAVSTFIRGVYPLCLWPHASSYMHSHVVLVGIWEPVTLQCGEPAYAYTALLPPTVSSGEAKKVLKVQQRLEAEKIKDEPAAVGSAVRDEAEAGEAGDEDEDVVAGGGGDDDSGSGGGGDDDDEDDDDDDEEAEEEDDDDDDDEDEDVAPEGAAGSSSSSNWPVPNAHPEWGGGYPGYFLPPSMHVPPHLQPHMPFGYPPSMGYPGMAMQPPGQQPPQGSQGSKKSGKAPMQAPPQPVIAVDDNEELYCCEAEAEGGIRCDWAGLVRLPPIGFVSLP